MLNLTAVVAPTPRAAAESYPANYWYSLIKVPAKSEFPGTGANGNGINENMKSQAQWIRLMKTDSCESCHQIGSKGTREIPEALGAFRLGRCGWERRDSIRAGRWQHDAAASTQLGTRRALRMFGDWTDRIAAGDTRTRRRRARKASNATSSSRSGTGPIRSVYLHDEIATDKRNPTVERKRSAVRRARSQRGLPVRAGSSESHEQPRRSARARSRTRRSRCRRPASAPPPYWGEEADLGQQGNVHNPMFDENGRVWFTSRIRGNDNPAFCKEGSNHPSAKLTPRHHGAAASGCVRSEDQDRPHSSIPASARITCCSPKTRTTRCGRAAAAVAASWAG